MDLALNNVQRLICHKTQQTKPTNKIMTMKYMIIRIPTFHILFLYKEENWQGIRWIFNFFPLKIINNLERYSYFIFFLIAEWIN